MAEDVSEKRLERVLPDREVIYVVLGERQDGAIEREKLRPRTPQTLDTQGPTQSSSAAKRLTDYSLELRY